MSDLDLTEACWHKSSFSGTQGCVEVAPLPVAIAVRDSKDPHSQVLAFNHDEWAAFVAGVKNGEFDA